MGKPGDVGRSRLQRNGGFPEVVFAQASPRSVGGASLFDAGGLVTASSALDYTSEPSVIRAAVERLQAAGFEILQVSSTTINIAAPPSVYEQAFGTRLVIEERPVTKEFGEESTATFIDTPDTDMVGLISTAGSPLSDVLEGVAIEEPVYFHAESAFAPTVPYWHLRVPGDVALATNADPAHRRGVTGKNVKVVMVDSGWYRHPYFSARGYRFSPPVLGPGATGADVDENGHGTGESANAFAVAPDIDFTMVKFHFANSTGAFNAAAALDPQVISCSWGHDIRSGPLAAAHQALAAAVAAAVAAGIVVVFSAGNCQFGFPGQHPDVVSAGGVYMDRKGMLKATAYTSGFASRVYASRKVPDVSGLVGEPPRAAYIMLPVPAGCAIDRDLGGASHPDKDETATDDGWAAFSGTSAAAPQVAGVCALLRQACPGLDPSKVREILMKTARDVTAGTNCQGEKAGPDHDLATGAGLVDAHRAVLEAELSCLKVKLSHLRTALESDVNVAP